MPENSTYKWKSGYKLYARKPKKNIYIIIIMIIFIIVVKKNVCFINLWYFLAGFIGKYNLFT